MSKVIIKLDNSGNVILPTMVLATRSGKKLGTILTEENKLTASLENGYSLSFIVNKYLDGHENNVWDSIDNFKLLYIPDWDIWFEMYVSIAENSSIVKEVECTSLCEAELSQIMLYNIEINTETDISREDYEPTIIYNDKNPAASLLDRIMEKTPHYCIEHVDKSIAKLQRTFTFDGKSVRDAMHEVAEEINALLVLNSGSNLDGTITRGISLYDLEEHCEDCGYRGKSSNGQCPECGSVNWSYGYGEDSGIFISSENLSNDIKLTTDTDKIKNCFKLVAGDDLMTATVAGCCPNGIGYLWYLTEDTKNDMSAELRSRLDSYDRLTADIEKKHWTLSDSDYSALATKYGKEKWDSIDGYADLLNAMYDTIDFQLYLEHSMMPDTSIPETTAQEQMNKLVANLSPVAVQNLSVLSSTTATSYVAQAIRAIVDPRYSVTTSEETLNGNNWSGTIKLTRSSDETDTVTRQNVRVALNDDFVNYLKTLIDRTINTTKLEEFDIIALFDMSLTRFAGEIRKYSLTYLQTFYDAAQSCLNVLIERGAGNDSVSPEAYNTLYTNYYDKRETLQREITLREQEISTIEYKQNTIDRQINQVHDDLDLEKYLGEKLWLELAAYRREDTYKNDNFISDGLSNAELFEKAREFIERAKSDIENSNYGQHEITSSLYNLLLMPEFKKLYDGFALGNWLRIRVDGEIYLLRLIEYSLDFTNLQNINVVYSDVTEQNLFYNAAMDSESNYKSMASTYGNVSRQASHGNDSNKQLRSWVSDGLQATLTRFMSDAVNQNIMWDSNGLLFRRYDDITEDYSPEQLRIINSTIAVTDDNWKTVKTAVGGFDYLDPVTQKVKHGYGINAELLIGKLILGEELGLYNPSNSLTFDRNGLTITNGNNSFKVSPDGANLFVVECGKDNKVMWVDEEGGLHLKPTSFELSTGETIEDVANEVLEKFKEEVYNPEVQALSDSKIETWYQATDPSTTSEWLNDGETQAEANNRHEGDIWYDTSDGSCERWNGNTWVEVTSKPPQSVFDSIDGKAQIFVGTDSPTTPYHEGDLWFKSETDPIYVSTATRLSGACVLSDWVKKDKYIDESGVGTIIDNTLTQEDVFNRLTGGGVNEGIYLEDGHIYINASYIKSGTITADLIKGGTLNLGGNNDQFGTLVIKNSSGAEIGRWDSDGISIKSGSLDASLIKTGKISADRIDTDSLYVSAVYTPNMYEFSKRQAVLYAHIPSGLTTVALYIGGDADNYLNAGRYLVSSMFLLSTGNIYIGDNTTTSQTNGTLLLFDIANKTFRPQTSSATWSFGTSTYPWKNGYISTANITSEYVTKTYAKTLFSYYSTSASSSSTYGIYITNNQIYSNYTSSSAKSYLGTSSHYWDYGYIDNLYTKSYVQIGSTSNSKVGFFGTTPVVRKSVSSASTSSNVTASSVATSLNALITALKGYGLIS